MTDLLRLLGALRDILGFPVLACVMPHVLKCKWLLSPARTTSAVGGVGPVRNLVRRLGTHRPIPLMFPKFLVCRYVISRTQSGTICVGIR